MATRTPFCPKNPAKPDCTAILGHPSAGSGALLASYARYALRTRKAHTCVTHACMCMRGRAVAVSHPQPSLRDGFGFLAPPAPPWGVRRKVQALCASARGAHAPPPACARPPLRACACAASACACAVGLLEHTCATIRPLLSPTKPLTGFCCPASGRVIRSPYPDQSLRDWLRARRALRARVGACAF